MTGVCTKFVECYKGAATIKDCPPGTHFCVKSLMCDWPTKAVCDQVSNDPTYSMTTSSSVVSVVSSVSDRNEDVQADSFGDYIIEYYSDDTSQPSTASDEQYPNIDWSDVILARNIDVIPSPPSGQIIRLRQGKSPSEGYVEIFSNNVWGYVCDRGSWTMKEADIVCKQLGFSRGVKKTTQGLVHGPVDQDRRATEDVNCSGDEEFLEDCQHTHKVR